MRTVHELTFVDPEFFETGKCFCGNTPERAGFHPVAFVPGIGWEQVDFGPSWPLPIYECDDCEHHFFVVSSKAPAQPKHSLPALEEVLPFHEYIPVDQKLGQLYRNQEKIYAALAQILNAVQHKQQ